MVNVEKTKNVLRFLEEQSITLTTDGLLEVRELSGNIIMGDIVAGNEVIGLYTETGDIHIFDEYIKPSNLIIEIEDEEGKHELLADRDCVWKCVCTKEIRVAEKHLDSNNILVNPECPRCGTKMSLRYWLDCQ